MSCNRKCALHPDFTAFPIDLFILRHHTQSSTSITWKSTSFLREACLPPYTIFCLIRAKGGLAKVTSNIFEIYDRFGFPQTIGAPLLGEAPLIGRIRNQEKPGAGLEIKTEIWFSIRKTCTRIWVYVAISGFPVRKVYGCPST